MICVFLFTEIVWRFIGLRGLLYFTVIITIFNRLWYRIFQVFTVKIYFVQIWPISAVLLKTGKCRWFEITSYNNEPFSILFPSRLTWQKKVWKSSTTPSKSPTRTFSASSWLTWIRSHSLSTFTSLKWLDIAEPQTSSRPSVSRCLNVFNGPTPATFLSFQTCMKNCTCERMPIQYTDSNPQPSDHESPPITTRPGLLPSSA